MARKLEGAETPKRKVEIWVAVAPFELGKVGYESGDELALPPGYSFDEEQTVINKGRPTFKQVQVRGTTKEPYEVITYEILPVARPSEVDGA